MNEHRKKYTMQENVIRTDAGRQQMKVDAGLWFTHQRGRGVTKHPDTIEGTQGHGVELFIFESILESDTLLCQVLQDQLILGMLASERALMNEVGQFEECKQILTCKGGVDQGIFRNENTIVEAISTSSPDVYPDLLIFMAKIDCFCRKLAGLQNLKSILTFKDGTFAESGDTSRVRKMLWSIPAVRNLIHTQSFGVFVGLPLPNQTRQIVTLDSKREGMFSSHENYIYEAESHDIRTSDSRAFATKVEKMPLL